MELIRAGAARCACVRARVPLLTLLYNVYPLLRLHRLLTPTPPPTPTKRTRRRTQRRHRITNRLRRRLTDST